MGVEDRSSYDVSRVLVDGRDSLDAKVVRVQTISLGEVVYLAGSTELADEPDLPAIGVQPVPEQFAQLRSDHEDAVLGGNRLGGVVEHDIELGDEVLGRHVVVADEQTLDELLGGRPICKGCHVIPHSSQGGRRTERSPKYEVRGPSAGI